MVSDGEYRRLNWQVSFSRVRGWDLWAGSWKGFLASPDLLRPGERPLTRGEEEGAQVLVGPFDSGAAAAIAQVAEQR